MKFICALSILLTSCSCSVHLDVQNNTDAGIVVTTEKDHETIGTWTPPDAGDDGCVIDIHLLPMEFPTNPNGCRVVVHQPPLLIPPFAEGPVE